MRKLLPLLITISIFLLEITLTLPVFCVTVEIPLPTDLLKADIAAPSQDIKTRLNEAVENYLNPPVRYQLVSRISQFTFEGNPLLFVISTRLWPI